MEAQSMSVYVDDMEAPFGRLVMCHMIADTHDELIAMADRIGVARRWLQSPGLPTEHFDVCKTKRALAVKAGAIEITWRDLAVRVRARRTPEGKAAYIAAAPPSSDASNALTQSGGPLRPLFESGGAEPQDFVSFEDDIRAKG
jgi:hypothetical protein